TASTRRLESLRCGGRRLVQRSVRAVRPLVAGGDDIADDLTDRGVVELAISVLVDHCHHRKDLAVQVGATGGGVVVGGVVERLHANRGRLGLGEIVAEQLLQRTPREQRTGTDAVERVLFVAPTGDVVGEDPSLAGGEVVAGEQWY